MIGVHKVLVSHLGNVKSKIIQAMASNGRNASGKSAASLNVVETDSGAALEGSKSFLVMERGRKGGRLPRNFVSIIREWIVAKGISYDDMIPKNGNREAGLMRLSSAIAFSIMKNGTKLHRDHGYNDIFTSAIDSEMPLIENDTIVIFENEIDRIHQNVDED